ncbi:hypothetical protein RvY_01007-2 [Ramazzottius varieornatus]|uniref:Uncharacterized protein n=1 Tax=Ramazzottius varieornatus TaxID=947166 RepID=A0A1D1UKV6_RAMVA|nr:hypothetical protein RvY_01007-2 [Ramazzottius varieornatus]
MESVSLRLSTPKQITVTHPVDKGATFVTYSISNLPEWVSFFVFRPKEAAAAKGLLLLSQTTCLPQI